MTSETSLTAKEEALYREGLLTAPSLSDMPDPHIPYPGRSLLQITTAEWADRCRRLFATLDATRSLLREAIETVHQTGSIRDHSDPNDTTGWNVHGIETCADPLCVDALAALRDHAT